MTKTDAFMYGFLLAATVGAWFWAMFYNVWMAQ